MLAARLATSFKYLEEAEEVADISTTQVSVSGALSIINNYLGQLREKAVEVIELLYKPFLDKILMIGIPQSNISDI